MRWTAGWRLSWCAGRRVGGVGGMAGGRFKSRGFESKTAAVTKPRQSQKPHPHKPGMGHPAAVTKPSQSENPHPHKPRMGHPVMLEKRSTRSPSKTEVWGLG